MVLAWPDIPGLADIAGAPPQPDDLQQALAIIGSQPAPVAPQQPQATYDAPPATAPQASGKYSPEVERWRGQITQEFQKQGVPTSLNGVDLIDKALHVVQGESGGNDKIGGDGGAAYGLFQSHYVGTGASSSAQIADAVRLIAKNPAQWTDWGEGATYQGKPFGALGRTPYGSAGQGNAFGDLASLASKTAQIGDTPGVSPIPNARPGMDTMSPIPNAPLGQEPQYQNLGFGSDTGVALGSYFGSQIANPDYQSPTADIGSPVEGNDFSSAPIGSLRYQVEQARQGADSGAYGNLALGTAASLVLPQAAAALPGAGFVTQAVIGATASQAVKKIPGYDELPSWAQDAVSTAAGFAAGPGSIGAKALGTVGALGGERLGSEAQKATGLPDVKVGPVSIGGGTVGGLLGGGAGFGLGESPALREAAGNVAHAAVPRTAVGEAAYSAGGGLSGGNDLERQVAEQAARDAAEAAKLPPIEARPPEHLKTAPAVVEAPTTAYHGTGTNFQSFEEGALSQTSLYGPGVYLTDSRPVAEGYATSSEKKVANSLAREPAGMRQRLGMPELTPAAHLQQVTIPEGTKLVNLEQPLPKDVVSMLARNAAESQTHDIMPHDEEAWIDAAKAALDGKNGAEVYRAFRQGLGDSYVGDAGESLDVLNQEIKALGYDGLAHTGGAVRGGEPHNVTILFDAEKAQITGAERLQRPIDAGSAPPSGSPPSPPAGGPPAPPTLRGPSGGPPGGTPPTGATPTGPQMEPVAKLTEAIKAAGKATPEQRAMFAAERAQRTARAAGTLESGIASGQGAEAALNASRGTLGGEFARPTFAVPDFGAEDLAQLYNHVATTEDLRYYDRLGAQNALRDLVSGRIPQPADMDKLRRAFPQGGNELLNAARSKEGLNIWRELSGVLGLPQALQTMGDFSATLRQGAILGWNNPREWAGAVRQEMKAFASADEAAGSLRKIEQSPWFTRNDGLGFNDVGGHTYRGGIVQGELSTERAGGFQGLNESHVSGLVQRIPGVKQSERAFSTLLNEQGYAVYAKYAQEMHNAGITDPKQFEALASVINHARGYGSTNVGQIAQGFNAMYSGRNFISRFQVLMDPFTQPGSLNLLKPSARSLAATNLAGFIAGNLAVLGLVAEGAHLGLMPGVHVEGSPLSTDGLKIRIGNTRIDPWAGFLPLERLVVREATGKTKTSTGETIPVDRKAELIRFFKNKESPVVGLITSIFSGENAIGQKPLDPRSFGTIGQAVVQATGSNVAGLAADNLLPFIVNDVTDAYKQSGSAAAGVAGVMGLLGAGTSSYEPSVAEQKDQAAVAQFAGKPKLGGGAYPSDVHYRDLLPSDQKTIDDSGPISAAVQSRPQTEYQKVKETAYAPIQQQQAQAEAAFAQGDMTKPLPDRWAELQQQRIGTRATLEAAFTKTFSKFQKDQFDTALDGYFGSQVKNSDGTPNFDLSTVAQQKFLAKQSPEVQTWLNDFLDTAKENQSPLRKEYLAYLDSKDKAGYFANGADKQKLDAANPDIDVKGWYFRGGVKPGADGIDHTPSLNSAAAVDQALGMNLPNRVVKFGGLARNIAESDGAKAAWNDNKVVIQNYYDSDKMLNGGGRGVLAAAKLFNSTKDAEYKKPFDQMDSDHRSRVLGNVRAKLLEDHPDIDAALLVMGHSKDGKAHTVKAYNLASQMIQRYQLKRIGDYTITKAQDAR